VTCGGVGGGGLGGGSEFDVWVSFVATATSMNVTTDPSPSGTDSSFVVWDACGGNKIGCAEDIFYGPPGSGTSNYLGDTCVGGLNIGATYYVQLGAWCAGGQCGIPGYMGSCGVYDITVSDAGICGDSILDCGEQCDPPDGLHCNGKCQWICGDSVVQSPEDCDPPGLCCSANCRFVIICGNGCVEGAETCDDGNLISGDGCDSTCQREEYCGDGIVNGLEECDGTALPLCPGGSYCALNCICVVGIPAVSEWGLAVLTLIGLVSGTILFGRRRAAVR
jgi:cysteine-rich repeat protein